MPVRMSWRESVRAAERGAGRGRKARGRAERAPMAAPMRGKKGAASWGGTVEREMGMVVRNWMAPRKRRPGVPGKVMF
jgi:hypothetical protein